MSRDFSPRECWYANKYSDDLYLSNIKVSFNGKESWLFTQEELDDRKHHKYIAILGSDIYKKLRDALPNCKFEELNQLLGKLVKADENDEDLSGFPLEIKNWYFNTNGHHYREPNDEDFVEYLIGGTGNVGYSKC